MGKRRKVIVALYVFGVFLIAVGIGLSFITQTETRYREIFGQQIPHQEEIQPYLGIGVLIIMVGTVVIIVAFMKNHVR